MDVIRVINKVRLLSFDDFYTPRPLFAFLYACSLSLVPRTPTIAQGSIKEKNIYNHWHNILEFPYILQKSM